MAKIFGELTEEIGKLKRGLEKEIEKNKHIEVIIRTMQYKFFNFFCRNYIFDMCFVLPGNCKSSRSGIKKTVPFSGKP